MPWWLLESSRSTMKTLLKIKCFLLQGPYLKILFKIVIQVAADLNPIEAATMSVNPCTAYRMLKDFIPLKSGDVVIQNGANSAVGQCVIQMCRAEGIKSVNIIRNRPDVEQLKQELRSMGADFVLTEEELRLAFFTIISFG